MAILKTRSVGSFLLAAGLVSGLLAPPLLAVNPGPKRNASSVESPHVAGQLIVKLKDGGNGPAGGQSLQALHQQFGLRRMEPLFPQKAGSAIPASQRFSLRQSRASVEGTERARLLAAGFQRTFLLQVDEKADLKAAQAAYQKDPAVEYAELNLIASVQLVPNDPFFASRGTWGQAYNDMYGLHITSTPAAWDLSQGLGVVVAVVDTGLDYNHPDINDNVWVNKGEIPGNGIDDDGNGYVDDVRGWDTVRCDVWNYSTCTKPRPPDNDPMDHHGHGTHVSGTIAAEGNNGIGVIGVAYGARVMPVKGLNDQGQGTFADLAEALYYAANNGADVINNSWSGSGSSRQLIDEAVAYAHSLGVVVVAAAGNSSSQVVDTVPADIPDAVTVAATDTRDRIADFSNWGSVVDVSAPGVDILSLRAAGTDMYGGGTQVVADLYYRASGTSMSAPHVSGAAALLISRFPSLSNDEVRDALYFKSDNVDWTSPYFAGLMGGGRINPRRALAEPLDPPVLSISGTVTDPQGQPVAGARVQLWGAPGFPQTASGSDGSYVLPGLREGNYRAIPVRSGYEFDPPSRLYQPLRSAQVGQNFRATQQWDIQTLVSGVQAGQGGNSIAVDAQSRPHITYHTADQDLFYTKWTGSSWKTDAIERHDSTIYHPGRQNTLVLDSTGTPHVSYHGENPAMPIGYVKYARMTGSGWYVPLQLEAYPSANFTDTSLAVDAANRPHMVYTNRSGAMQLKYTRWDGSAWQTQVIDAEPYAFFGMTQNALVLDSQGRPHVVYHAIQSYPIRSSLRYAMWDGTAWRTSVVDRDLGANYGESAIVLDSQGRPRIAYVASQQDQVKYAVWTGTAWATETVTLEYGSNRSYYRTDLSLVLGPDDAPHILYWGVNLRYSTKKNGVWKTSVLHSGYAGLYHQLAIDAQGFLHASYYDWDTEQLKYARSRFSVNPSLRVVTPSAGTTWVAGSTYTISWQADNAPADAWVGTLRLWMDTFPVAEIRPPNGGQFPPTGSVQWTVPANTTPFSYYLIQGELKKGPANGGTVLTEAWSWPFTIVRP